MIGAEHVAQQRTDGITARIRQADGDVSRVVHDIDVVTSTTTQVVVAGAAVEVVVAGVA